MADKRDVPQKPDESAQNPGMNRRKFLQTTAAAGAVATGNPGGILDVSAKAAAAGAVAGTAAAGPLAALAAPVVMNLMTAGGDLFSSEDFFAGLEKAEQRDKLLKKGDKDSILAAFT